MPFPWDQPFKSVSGTVGSQKGSEHFLYLNNGLADFSIDQNKVGGDPFKIVAVTPSGAEFVTYYVNLKYKKLQDLARHIAPTPETPPVVPPTPVTLPVVDCTITSDGVTVSNSPPCDPANIEAGGPLW